MQKSYVRQCRHWFDFNFFICETCWSYDKNEHPLFTSERKGRSEAKAKGGGRNGEPPCQGETAHQAGSDPRFSSALWL